MAVADGRQVLHRRRSAGSETSEHSWHVGVIATSDAFTLRSLRLENDRHRAVVDEFDLHSGAEDAHLDLDSETAQLVTDALVERPGDFRPRGLREVRPSSLLTFAIGEERELTTSAEPPVSRSERSKRPSSSSKIRRWATLPASRSESATVSPSATPRRTSRPASISPRTTPATPTEARETRCRTALRFRPGP